MERLKVLNQLDAVLAEADASVPLAVRYEIEAAAHKLRYPMADILAKVYGDTLSERARRIGVSRQTMYVWANERFRPTPTQARIISDLTAVPVEHITDDGFEVEVPHDTGRKARAKTERVAARTEKMPRRARLPRGAKRRVVDDEGRDGNARKVRKRPSR